MDTVEDCNDSNTEEDPVFPGDNKHVDEKLTREGRLAAVKKKVRNCFTRKNLHRRLPFLTWIRSYSTSCFLGDLVSGFTVGLMIIPQGLAYGVVAGLTPDYGLYSAFCCSFLYVVFGSTTELNIGPTAIMALMTYQYTSNGGADYAVLLCFLTGLIEVIAGIINLGFLINFISQPVISGFTSAAAITIASSQLKPLFGLKLKTQGLIDTWVKVISNLGDFRWQDLTLGIACIIVLSVMKPLRDIKWPCIDAKSKSIGQRIVRQLIFFLSVGRNALVVIIASFIAFSYDGEDQPFSLTGYVQSGIPPISLPAFSTTINNQTVTFSEMVSDIGLGVVMVPFIAILDDIAVVSAFAKGRTFDANQEIFAMGAGTLLGSFFGSMPTTASLSRTAVNLTSGVRTPAGGIITGIMVLLALSFLTPAFYYIPKATLAAVIICAVLHMLDYEIIRPMWRTKRIDLLPLAITFFGCLIWGLEWGIILGIGYDLAKLLYSIAKPLVTTSKQSLRYVQVTPAHGISFPNVSHIRSAIRRAGVKEGEGTLPVVIDCTFIDTADYTSAKGIKGLVDDFKRRDQSLVFVGLRPTLQKTITSLHKDVTLCPSFDDLDETLGDGQVQNKEKM
ncbi:hypothetical protein SK128_001813 [Halocaridina rubra]|uniref:STAS domain-containing protein n=1 Tax=Halocaridina rubra TaxID=373956 RepID=A0AAN8WWY9_HALRR